jgi:HAD superfamily hydrolase (TIGR01509 family)
MARETRTDPSTMPAIIFDLDGTLVDSVYQHVLAWQAGLQEAGIDLSVWRIHRRIGMSGGLLSHALLREAGRPLDEAVLRQIQEVHTRRFVETFGQVRALPGSISLLRQLSEARVDWGIATSGRMTTAGPSLQLLGIADGSVVVTHDDVRHAKPDPDLFVEAARRLKRPIEDCAIVGDSVWDLLAARRCRALGIGLQSGGYGREELQSAGAYRVYDDPADLLEHLDEIGIRV